MSRQDQLMSMLTPTQLWADMNPDQQGKIAKMVAWTRKAMPDEGCMWLMRILRRAFVVLSRDVEGSDKWDKASEALKSQGYSMDRCVDDFNKFVSIDSQRGGGISQLEHVINGMNARMAPLAQANLDVRKLNPKVVELLIKGFGEHPELHHAPECARRSGDGKCTCKFLDIERRVMELAPLRAAIAIAFGLENIKWQDESGKDQPFNKIYTEINSVGSALDAIEKLPEGTPLVTMPDGSKWVALDCHGNEHEAKLMGHPLGGHTKVITSEGLKTIKELAGQTVDVLSWVEGQTEKAAWTAGMFDSRGVQELYKVTLRCEQWRQTFDVEASPNHRWFILGSPSTEYKFSDVATIGLKVGDRVPTLYEEAKETPITWAVEAIERTGRFEEVFCAVVPGSHSFAIEHHIVQSNCGNVGGRKSDILVSYRVQSPKFPGYFEPRLTFILGRDGVLGEMKGRYNNKPEKEYHPAIMALLKLPNIKGMAGSGYLPSHNFSLNDLDQSLFKELVAAKPAMVKAMLDAEDHNQRLDHKHAEWFKQATGQQTDGPAQPELDGEDNPLPD